MFLKCLAKLACESECLRVQLNVRHVMFEALASLHERD